MSFNLLSALFVYYIYIQDLYVYFSNYFYAEFKKYFTYE